MAELVAEPLMCEEAAPGYLAYRPCNKPAVVLIGWPETKEGPYRMCLNCGDYNLRSRGAKSLGSYSPAAQKIAKALWSVPFGGG